MFRVAVFADIHGKFLLPFKLVDHYQKTTGKQVDLILQCGDMGAFPDKSRMDKATLRHAKRDRDELGFIDQFAFVHTDIAEFLDTLNIDMLCVRGNHEDHEFLDKLEEDAKFLNHSAYPIDAYNRVWVCRTGLPITFTKSASQRDKAIRVGDFVKIPLTSNKKSSATFNRDSIAVKDSIAVSDSLSVVGIGRIGDRKARNYPQYIQDYERASLNKLIKQGGEYDVLITHDKASDSQRGYGSEEIEQLLNNIPFAYHFYGHTGEKYKQMLDGNGVTVSVKVRELEFNKQSQLEAGCMLIIEKMGNDVAVSDDNMTVTPVPLNEIIGFNKQTWHYM